MAEINSKIERLTLEDGNTVELTLNFKKMLWLRANGYTKEVEIAMKVVTGDKFDMLEIPYYFYAAYLCGLKTTEKPAYTQEEFIALVPWDMEAVSNIFANLNSKKKVEASKMRSSAARRNKK